MPTSDIERDIQEICGWAGENEFCYLCFDSKAYINTFMTENRTMEISPSQQAYLHRLDQLFDAIDKGEREYRTEQRTSSGMR